MEAEKTKDLSLNQNKISSQIIKEYKAH